MSDTEGLRLWVFGGGLVFFALLETLRPDRAWTASRPRRWGLHLAIAAGNGLIVRTGLAAPFFLWAAYAQGRGWGLMPVLGLTGAAEIALSLVLLDMLNYWWHRINHAWPLLWRFHKAHHSDDHVDVSTSLRFHPGELLLSWAAKGVWVLLVGPSVTAFLIFESLVSFAAQFHHSNWRLSPSVDRLVRKFVPSPLFHAAHHTKEPRSRSGNYSTILVLWDRLFGTFHEPELENLQELGLPGPQKPLSPLRFLAEPIR